MIRPRITRDAAIGKLPEDISAGLSKFASKYTSPVVMVIAFRGYYLDTMGVPGQNDRGIYDDCMCAVWPEGFVTFNGNTDPSRHKESVATLVPGLHFYKQGKHGITTHADGGYLAFRPATPDESLPVWRDGEDWGVKVFKGIAINLHKGGYTTTSSEGCQTIYPDQWLEFQQMVYHLMDKYKQSILPYALVDFKQ
jgi:lysozyme